MSKSSPGLRHVRGRGEGMIALMGWLCLAGLFVWLFAAVLFADRNFVFRDAAHFYHPLFKLIQEQWATGWAPLWNPYENAGSPLLAWGVSSVFYPGKLLFALPVSYDTAFKIYTLSHVALAAFGAWRLARYWDSSPAASALAAECYAFGGSVLFQYCNVVFLVSAAWAPLAVWQADRMLRGRRWGAAAGFGLTLAMMTLGGDPQMAYLMVLLAAGYGWLLRREERREACREERRLHDAGDNPAAQGAKSVRGLLHHRVTLLMLAAAIGLGLAAVQVLPSLELTQHSARAVRSAPRSLYETPAYFAQKHDDAIDATPWYSGLLAKPSADGAHLTQLYEFSVGPWRWAEFFWPNVGGRQFPTHRRWFHVIPAEGRVWVPSLYLGLAPLVLAIGCWRLRSGDARLRWLSWLALLSLLGALGAYGVGWLVREIVANWSPAARSPDGWPVGDGCGGLYWLATVAAPGFVNFRYPAKLLTLTSLAVAMLAAGGWDSARETRHARRVSRLLLALIGVSLIGGLAALAIRPVWATWMQSEPADPLFGPFQADGAWWDLFTAFGQTTIVASALWALWLRRRRGSTTVAATLVLLLTAIDLGLANGWMIVSAPAELWRTPSQTAELMRRDAASRAQRLYRADRPLMWMRPSWQVTASDDRQRQGLVWDRQTLWPKYNLGESVALLQTPGTFDIYDYRVFLSRLRRRGVKNATPSSASGLNSLNVRYAILPRYQPELEPGPTWRPLPWPTGQDAVPDARVWVNTQAGPRAWIVRRVEVLPPLTSRSPRSIAARTDAALFVEGKPRDLQTSACVEAAAQRLPEALRTIRPSKPDTASSQSEEVCRVTRYESRRIEIEVDLHRPGLLVVCDTYYPGWRASVRTAGAGDWRPAPVLRANRVMRGVWIPSGRHTVTLTYRPASFIWGAGISAVCWSGFAALALIGLFRRRRAVRGAQIASRVAASAVAGGN